jgi:putative acetyltransferase
MTAVRLRPERSTDVPAIRAVVGGAFARPDVAVPAEVDLIEALRGGDAWLPELSMVAEVDGEVVGYALLSRVRVVDRTAVSGPVPVGSAGYPALALGPVAVSPGQQRRGYGTAVVQAALNAAGDFGERLVVVLGSPPYYRRFGFRPAAEFGLTSAWSGLGAPWQALILSQTTGKEAPPPAGEVVFPAPWGRV